jgi:Domain of unknown function (DUF305)
MHSRPGHYWLALAASALVSLLALGMASKSDDEGHAFLIEAGQAMTKMDSGMMAAPTGDADHDFVQMMVPHHQGAIAMAVAELRYGRDQRLRRIAQEIIVDQQQEIAAMRLALGQPLPPSVAAPDQAAQASTPASPTTLPFKICKGSPQ